MPLKFDPEYGREIKILRDGAQRSSREFWWGSLLMAGGLLAAVVGGLHYANVPDGLAITATLAVSALCVIAVINSGVNAVHATLVVLIGATEWVGRKQLGEYESPVGGGQSE